MIDLSWVKALVAKMAPKPKPKPVYPAFDWDDEYDRLNATMREVRLHPAVGFLGPTTVCRAVGAVAILL